MVVKRGHTEAKESNTGKGVQKMKGPKEVKEPTEVNFKHGGGQKTFSLAPLAKLSPALPVSK